MKTKLEATKDEIGYIVKDPPACGNCESFSSVKKTPCGYEKETMMRCDRYGFATKKMNYCNGHKRKLP